MTRPCFLWDIGRRQEVAKLTGHSAHIQALAFAPDGKTLASATFDHTVTLWDTNTQQELAALKLESENARSIAFSPDGRTFAAVVSERGIRSEEVSSSVPTIFLWFAATKEEVAAAHRKR